MTGLADHLIIGPILLPLLAAARAAWEFFSERVTLEAWPAGGAVPVEVELEPPPPPVPVLVEPEAETPATPPEPPAAAHR